MKYQAQVEKMKCFFCGRAKKKLRFIHVGLWKGKWACRMCEKTINAYNMARVRELS